MIDVLSDMFMTGDACIKTRLKALQTSIAYVAKLSYSCQRKLNWSLATRDNTAWVNPRAREPEGSPNHNRCNGCSLVKVKEIFTPPSSFQRFQICPDIVFLQFVCDLYYRYTVDYRCITCCSITPDNKLLSFAEYQTCFSQNKKIIQTETINFLSIFC